MNLEKMQKQQNESSLHGLKFVPKGLTGFSVTYT